MYEYVKRFVPSVLGGGDNGNSAFHNRNRRYFRTGCIRVLLHDICINLTNVGERTKNNRRSATVCPRVKVTTDVYVRTYYIYCTHTIVPSPGPVTVYVFT